MIFGPKRQHFVVIFDGFIKDVGMIVLALIIALLIKDNKEAIYNLILFVLALQSPCQKFFRFISTYCSVDDSNLIIKKGLIFRSTTEVPLTHIVTINKTQNPLYRFMGVEKLNIDNLTDVSSSGGESRISLAFKKDTAEELLSLLLANSKNSEQILQPELEGNDKTMEVSVGKLILMGLLRGKMVYFFQGLAALLVLISALGGDELLITRMENLMVAIAAGLFIFCVFAAVAIYITFSIVSIILAVIKYYNFKVVMTKDKIHISYGLFTKRNYSFSPDKVSGVTFTQSALMRIVKKGTLMVYVAGYGDNVLDNEEAILHPFLCESELDYILKEFIPNLAAKSEYIRPEQGAKRYFFFCPRFIFSLILFVSSVIVSYVIGMVAISLVFALLLLLSIVSVLMEISITACYGNNENVSIITGGLRKETHFIQSKKIESVSEKAFTRKRKRGYTTIVLGILGPSLISERKAKNLTFDTYHLFQDFIEY